MWDPLWYRKEKDVGLSSPLLNTDTSLQLQISTQQFFLLNGYKSFGAPVNATPKHLPSIVKYTSPSLSHSFNCIITPLSQSTSYHLTLSTRRAVFEPTKTLHEVNNRNFMNSTLLSFAQ